MELVEGGWPLTLHWSTAFPSSFLERRHGKPRTSPPPSHPSHQKVGGVPGPRFENLGPGLGGDPLREAPAGGERFAVPHPPRLQESAQGCFRFFFFGGGREALPKGKSGSVLQQDGGWPRMEGCLKQMTWLLLGLMIVGHLPVDRMQQFNVNAPNVPDTLELVCAVLNELHSARRKARFQWRRSRRCGVCSSWRRLWPRRSWRRALNIRPDALVKSCEPQSKPG